MASPWSRRRDARQSAVVLWPFGAAQEYGYRLLETCSPSATVWASPLACPKCARSRCAERAGESSLTSSGNHFARWLRGERPLFVVGEGGGGKQHRGHMRDDLKFSTRKSCVSFCGRMDLFTSQPGVSPRISCGRVAGGLAFLASLTRTWKSCAGAPLGSPWRKADSRLTFRSPTRV
jgi:hypothetical protein